MSALEQSLDAIIASDKAKTPARASRKAATGRVAKSARTSRSRASAKSAATAAIAAAALKKARKRNAKSPTAPRAVIPSVDASSLEMATKVVVSGLPTDIKPHNVKEFFQSELGGVASVLLSYNERGQSTGVATVVFKRAATARKAVAKYNNAPIDGKKKTLKLELVVDPAQKSLAARITPNVLTGPTSLKAKLQGKRARRAPQPIKKAAKPAKKAPAKKSKPKNHKKTVAELDQEMADYFAKGQQQQ
ncbi:DEKNAAC101579 [Brettanomyces naardenensis]|uniref:DEKNAAC101580 n=1 Tax=Brettanomyces naardenensis TaxID=13370 RepID=A0A448YIM9_BRENA|nr:DEKNAAC101579 [Brettanomyces naardenensis]